MVPLLKTLCGVKVVVLLSVHPDVKDRIFTTITIDDYLDDVEKEIVKELKADLQIKFLNMFNSFPPNLVNFVPLDLAPFIVGEMLDFANLLEYSFGLTEEFSRNFIKYSIFSSNGTIDEELAGRELLKEPNLSTSVLFKVASYFCFDDIIVTIWEKEPILRETLNESILLISEKDWLWYLEEKEKYLKNDVNVNNSSLNLLSRLLFDLLSSAIEFDNFAAFKFVWKTVEESKEFQNFGEFEGHKCIAVFNKFCKKWILKLSRKIIEELQCKTKSQFYSSFYMYGKVLKFILSQMTIEEIKDFLSYFKTRYAITYCILFIFLHWPYLDQFMDMAESLFCILSNPEYYILMQNILDLISRYGNYDMPYSYRLLMREFWIKSPLHLKKQVITLEQMETEPQPLYWRFVPCTKKILEKLILHCNFTPDDEYNFLMILKDATHQEKNNIFKFQGELICDSLISRGDYKLTDFFLQSLNVDDETQQSFKKDLVINNFREVMKLQRLELVTQLIKWAFSNGEIKTIKQEIFSKWFEFNKTAYLYMSSDIAISFLDEIFKLLLNKDEIAEWKQNGTFNANLVKSLLHGYCKSDRFDPFLKWIGYTEEKISETKENILLIILENGFSVYIPYKKLTDMIFYLCSNNKNKISDFLITLLAICDNTYAGKDTRLHCHDGCAGLECGSYEHVTIKDINKIHSYFCRKLDSLETGSDNEVSKF